MVPEMDPRLTLCGGQLSFRLLPNPNRPHYPALGEHREHGGGRGSPFTVGAGRAVSATPNGSPASRRTPSANRVISLRTKMGLGLSFGGGNRSSGSRSWIAA